MPLPPARLLIIPGLHDSGPAHWQSWLQQQFPGARRVVQRDFSQPDLSRWAERIQRNLESAGDGPWVAVAHSFGTLALARHLADHEDSPIREALLVAPADPDRFGLGDSLPRHRLGRPCHLVASLNDPWMSLAQASRWALRWGAHLQNLGHAGHINTESGHGPWPFARHWTETALRRVDATAVATAG